MQYSRQTKILLWKVIRDQPGKKVYSASLLKKHQALLRQYKGENK